MSALQAIILIPFALKDSLLKSKLLEAVLKDTPSDIAILAQRRRVLGQKILSQKPPPQDRAASLIL